MELQQLRCFVAVAETLHFGRAAQKLNMLPASLGRHVRMLEESIGISLLERTTRSVALTEVGYQFLNEARDLVERADQLKTKFRRHSGEPIKTLRLGVIDSAAAGLMPQLLPLFQQEFPRINIQLLEQKTIRLLPRIVSGRLDIAIVRPPDTPDARLDFEGLFYETPVVAVPETHPLAGSEVVTIHDLAEQALIIPDRRSRPHSHDLSIHLFTENGLVAQVAQIAEEKQTIVQLVNAGIGLAIVPKWTSRLGVSGVRFLQLVTDDDGQRKELALSACWLKNARDPTRERFMSVLRKHLSQLAATA